MTLNIIPQKMKARHIDTGAWETLHLDEVALYWLCIPWECYVDDAPDGVDQVDFSDFDSFEAA
jgi:hypothetical protein